MAEDNKPRLSVVRDVDVPKVKLPDLPKPTPESKHFRDLRRKVTVSGTSIQDAARLAAIGLVLTEGASEMRPCMSAKAARAWVQKHADDTTKANTDVIGCDTREASYAHMADLREAVLGAAAEVDEAGINSPGLVSALYTVVGRIESFPISKMEIAAMPEPDPVLTWVEKIHATYWHGVHILGTLNAKD